MLLSLMCTATMHHLCVGLVYPGTPCECPCHDQVVNHCEEWCDLGRGHWGKCRPESRDSLIGRD